MRKSALKVCAALLCAGLLYESWLFCNVLWYASQNPASSAVMRQELDQLRQTDPSITLKHEWMPYARISPALKRAVIASEDANFLDHDGVEWDAIREAWEYNQRQAALGKPKRRGGSTITQQVAKNLFLSNSRNYLRKGQEVILSYMMEQVMSKQRILELYLNIAEWGEGVFGAQAAAQHYYHIDAARLDNTQAARLAAMLPNPRYYDKHRDTAYLNARAATIAARMPQADIP